MANIFNSQEEFLLTLSKFDRLVIDCVLERISFSQFLQSYDSFYKTYALDGHESGIDELNLLRIYEDRISLHRQIWEQIECKLCADDDAAKAAYIAAGRIGSREALRRLKALYSEYLKQASKK